MGRILVGVDGSEGASRALQVAAEEARLRGPDASLVVVHAYRAPRHHSPYAYSYPYLPDTVVAQLSEDVGRWFEQEDAVAREEADRLVDRMIADALGPQEKSGIERLLVAAEAAPTLIDLSRDADLLVVGSRGLGGFAGLLLGSVSQYALHHATCPVLVVR